MMKTVLKVSVIAMAICTSTIAIGGEMASVNTRQDLQNAMKDRAFDHLKYTLYAEQAKKNGNTEAAATFERIAAAEHKHFEEHAKYFGLVPSEDDNRQPATRAEQLAAAGTREDLLNAMKDEAFKYLKYTFNAEQAKKNGNTEAAAAFERMAAAGRDEHFKEYAKNFGLVRSDAENMESAISGEYLAAKSYPAMASRARAVGDEEAAQHFANVAKDEAEHQKKFKAVFFKRNS